MENKERLVLNALLDLLEWSVREETESRSGDSEYAQGKASVFDSITYHFREIFIQSQENGNVVFDATMLLKGLAYDKTKELDLEKVEIKNIETEIEMARDAADEDFNSDVAKDNINYRQGCVDALNRVINYVDRVISELRKG